MKRTALLLAQLVLVVVLGAAAGAAGLPMPAVVIAAAGVGAALVVRHMAVARADGVEQRLPGALDTFEVTLPAERVAVGRLVQMRLLPPTRQVWAPGRLGVTRGSVSFLPARAKHTERAWTGQVVEAEVHRLTGTASVLRVKGAGGSAQFVVQASAEQAREALSPHLNLTAG